jgi:4-aminobutyrate aminotransferase-like enzyme
VGCILVEPVQARAGIRVPPPRFLPMLRTLCDRHGLLLVLDEIYTGFGRTGRWFACEHSRTVPDLICLGKGLTGGFPLSACVGRAGVMDQAWPASSGEAIHTSTFLGHPVGCAMALAQMEEIERKGLVQRSERLGKVLQTALSRIKPVGEIECSPKGIGLMAGLELRKAGRPASEEALGAVKEMLRRGFILLPEGEHGNVISFTPPLTISSAELERSLRALQSVLQHRSRCASA